jgi:glycine dehydrogenase subunit 2
MTEFPGASGLIFNEPLLWEKGATGRRAFSAPRRDVPEARVDPALAGGGPDFPDLCEVDVVRHYTRLSHWNFGVDSGMYPLGSCTMKYNPKINEKMAGLPGFGAAHPLLPTELSQGALELMFRMEEYLAEVTGLDAVSLQPAAGAQGELAGMLVIYAALADRGETRTTILVPDTAHGTNPATAALCGFEAKPLASGEKGILEPEDVAALMDEDSAGIMITNPNTLGLFEENSRAIADIVHEKGGLVYCDGANMNAIMGKADMAALGIDVLHLNLHKTFATPHGGGGPGAGPICVTSDLAPFLPVPRIQTKGDGFYLSEDFPKSIGKLHTFYGNFGVMIKAFSYILSLGPDLERVSELAVLNANYIKEQLKNAYHLPYDRPCMHECVFTDKIQKDLKIQTVDIAKRLMEFGFHPPTVYFPLVVNGSIMVEPTETEPKSEVDQFIAAMKAIAEEAQTNPDRLHEAPKITKVRRLDETSAARQPCLTGDWGR